MNTISPSFVDDFDLNVIAAALQENPAPSLKKCYLAGKIGKNDWRHKVVPNLRGHTWADGAIVTDKFTYVGPFFVACDHGCNHGPGSHGATTGCADDDSPFTPQNVIDNNMKALDSADLVFAYITAPDCYGTLVEIGYALHARKRVVMAFAPNIETQEFWYGAGQCAAVYYDVGECCLQHIIAAELATPDTMLGS